MARNRFDMDEQIESPFNWQQFKRILTYTRPYQGILSKTLVLLILGAALSLMTPMIMRRVINVTIPSKSVAELLLLTLAYMSLIGISSLFSFWRMRQMNHVGQSIIHDIRLDMFKHLQKLSFTYFDSRPHGKIQTRLINYVNSVSDLLSSGIVNSIVDLFSVVIILIYMIWMDPLLTLYAMAGLPFMFAVVFFFKNKQRKAQQRLNAKSSNLNAYSQESIEGMEISQLFGREEVNREIYHGLGSQFHRAWMHTVKLNMTLWPAIDVISNATIVFLYVAVVLWLKNRYGGPTNVGTIVAFVDYVRRFWGPIINLANFYNQLLSGASYIERIFEFLDEKPAVSDNENAVEMPKIKGEVKFENVTFSYEPGNPILKNLSFTVKPGETIALVGETGAGKTTVLNLLSRFYNIDSGKILIDGVDISKVTLDSLRRSMGVMLQEPYLFPISIMENIRYGRLEASDEECIRAAKDIIADPFIQKHENGYMTEIQEKGAGVSTGERQLISFARVMLADPGLLILDEATSGIDTRTERAVQEALGRLMKGRTSFVVAHRLSTIQNADRIFYIGKGGILEEGSHEELLLKNGYYAALHKAQLEETATRY